MTANVHTNTEFSNFPAVRPVRVRAQIRVEKRKSNAGEVY